MKKNYLFIIVISLIFVTSCNNTNSSTEQNGNFTSTTNKIYNIIGKNVVDYGPSQNANFLHMLENFANSTTPNSPLTGQLWFNTNANTLLGGILNIIISRPIKPNL